MVRQVCTAFVAKLFFELTINDNSTLLSFLTTYVLSIETLRFEDALKKASSLDEMILRHNEQYVFIHHFLLRHPHFVFSLQKIQQGFLLDDEVSFEYFCSDTFVRSSNKHDSPHRSVKQC
jgi:hypothetical protein